MIRKAIHDFVVTWNFHRIRKQSDRPYLISGRPCDLFKGILKEQPLDHDVGQNIGWEVDQVILAELRELVEPYDLNEYLPEDTLQCCLQYLDIVAPGNGYPILPEQDHEGIYTRLRQRLREHEYARREPSIRLLASPTGNLEWIELNAVGLDELEGGGSVSE